MELIKRGAEAELFKTAWHGLHAVKKVRIKKAYRDRRLDNRIRATRTKIEAMLLHKAKLLGIRTPTIFKVDLEKNELLVEYIDGIKAKECIEKNISLCKKIAKDIAMLHNAGLIHGDLTMDNIIVVNKEPVLIDFGLGFYSHKIEDKATDMLNLKKSLLALKPELKKEWNAIMRYYAKHAHKGKEIVKRMQHIESRVRYI